MMKSNTKIILFLFLAICVQLKADNAYNLNERYYKDLCGVWDIEKVKGHIGNFSWGKANVVINGSVVIDLGEDRPFFFAGAMGKSKIIKIVKKGNYYYLRIKFRNNKLYILKISIVNKDILVFHDMKWFKEIPLLSNKYGDKTRYYRIGKPSYTYKYPNVDKLRLREKENLKSKSIRLLEKNEKLFVLKKGNKTKIGNKQGRWIKVLTERNEIGWCFGYYLR